MEIAQNQSQLLQQHRRTVTWTRALWKGMSRPLGTWFPSCLRGHGDRQLQSPSRHSLKSGEIKEVVD